ncbi:MAG: questin oxidase family protein [Candidatus Neomarinimicrobiota bacterium]
MPGAYDEALQILAGLSPEYGEAQANAGPVVAAALMALDQPNAVVPWVQDYRGRLEPMPGAKQPLTRDNWRSALGDMTRIGDWVSFFQRELRQAPWAVVLRDWVLRLAPGIAGAAGHGFIRTAQAIRNLALEETDLRRGELARGMGYWAARFLRLPGILGSPTAGSLLPVEALARIKWQYKKRPRRFKQIGEGLQGLSGFSPFAGVINLVKIPAEPPELISQTTEAMARVFLAHSHDPIKIIPFILAVAVPSALRDVIRYVGPEGVSALLRYGWQFAGAMYAIYGRANPIETWEQPSEDRQQLAEQAVATGSEYAIIFSDVCLREYAVHSQPVYLAAAWEAVARLSPPSQDKSSGDTQE